jgi:cytochrome c oxidase cbb3-type subunit 3
MSDFTSGFWSLFVAGITLVSIVACALLLMSMSRRKVAADPDKTGHVWDEDLDEYNNPLPRWWIWLFWITIVFSLGYLWYYPGLGSWQGAGKWTSAGEYTQEVQLAEQKYGPMYARLAAADLKVLARDAEAQVVGQKLFLNYCSQCHASDARGAHDAPAAARGGAQFGTFCAACHGADGKGNPAMGAPNLTDGVWLYGSSEATIIETINKGRANVMPAHKEFLGEQRSHILAAYVYGLSQPEAPGLVRVGNKK